MEEKLVTVLVITFNSSATVIETLESIKQQSYRNLELIICDDVSTDTTAEICRIWLSHNSARFKTARVHVGDKNGGVSKNLNRGLSLASGDWIKVIAGDDLLTENCIDEFIAFVEVGDKASDPKVVFSKSRPFSDDESGNRIYHSFKYTGYRRFFNLTASKQFQLLLRRNYVQGPTLFVSRDFINDLGGFDRNCMIEDWSIALKSTLAGAKISLLDEELVHYRVHPNSLSNAKLASTIFSDFYLKLDVVDRAYAFKYGSLLLRFHKAYNFKLRCAFDRYSLNRNSLFNKVIFKLLFFANPVNIYERFIEK